MLDDQEWKGLQAVLGSIVHDINNLLTPIFLHADLLEEGLDGSGHSEKARAISSRAAEMKNMLEAMRFLYREDLWEQWADPVVFCRTLSSFLNHMMMRHEVQFRWILSSGAKPISRQSFGHRIPVLGRLGQRLAGVERGTEVAALCENLDPLEIRLFSPPPSLSESGAVMVEEGIHRLPEVEFRRIRESLPSQSELPLGEDRR